MVGFLNILWACSEPAAIVVEDYSGVVFLNLWPIDGFVPLDHDVEIRARDYARRNLSHVVRELHLSVGSVIGGGCWQAV